MLCAEIWRLCALFSKPLTFKIAGSSKSQHFRSSKSLHNRWLFESAAVSKFKTIFVSQFRSSKSILHKRYEILGQIDQKILTLISFLRLMKIFSLINSFKKTIEPNSFVPFPKRKDTCNSKI